jgi:hypothetical protein
VNITMERVDWHRVSTISGYLRLTMAEFVRSVALAETDRLLKENRLDAPFRAQAK